MNKNNFVSIISFFIYLLPISLMIGAAVSDLVLSLAAFFFIVYTMIYKDWTYYKKKIFLYLVIFCLYSILVSLTSEFVWNSLRSSLFYFRFPLVFIAMWFLLDRNKSFSYNFLLSIIFPLSIGILYSLYQLLDPTLSSQRLADFRISGFFGSELVQGGYYLRLVFISFGLFYLLRNNFKDKFFYFLIFSCSLFVILISGERAAIGLMLVGMFLLFIYLDIKILQKIYFFLLAVFLIFVSVIYIPGLKARVYDNTATLLVEKGNIKIFSRGHQEHYTSAIKMFKKNILTGVGVRNFRLECRKKEYKSIGVNACTTHPHNTYIQFLAETGIVGFSFIFLFLIYISKFLFKNFICVIKNKKIDVVTTVFAICVFINIFPLVPTGSFFNNWISAMYYLPLSFFFHNLEKNK